MPADAGRDRPTALAASTSSSAATSAAVWGTVPTVMRAQVSSIGRTTKPRRSKPSAIGATSLRMLFGWAFASLLGVVVGAAIGSSAMARDYLEPTLEFLRPLPASAVIPVAILFLGLSNEMSISVIAFGAIWPVLLSSVYGFGSLQVRLREVAAALGLNRIEFLRKIAFPAALPDILSGVRVSLAICLILAVVTEMQASLPGLGRDIFLAQRNFRSADLYAGLIMLGAIGFIVNYALLMVEQRLLRWRHPIR